jgi:hypothetical protein
MAEAAYFKALEDFERAKRQVLTSDAYKRAYAIASTGPNVNERLTALHKDSLEGDAEYKRTRANFNAAKTTLPSSSIAGRALRLNRRVLPRRARPGAPWAGSRCSGCCCWSSWRW